MSDFRVARDIAHLDDAGRLNCYFTTLEPADVPRFLEWLQEELKRRAAQKESK